MNLNCAVYRILCCCVQLPPTDAATILEEMKGVVGELEEVRRAGRRWYSDSSHSDAVDMCSA
jgi:hypothetical protein